MTLIELQDAISKIENLKAQIEEIRIPISNDDDSRARGRYEHAKHNLEGARDSLWLACRWLDDELWAKMREKKAHERVA